VAAIHLLVGAMPGVNKALRSAFEWARADSCFPNVELVIHEVPLEIFCRQCAIGAILEPPWKLQCPRCYGYTPDIIRGRELEIIALEIDS
jgi:hydrogenase nickel incorporation protein HypA/HybF